MSWLQTGLSLAAAGALAAGVALPGKEQKVDFKADIAPLIKAHCITCHNPESASSRLDMSTPDSLKKGGRAGALWVAGKPEASLLIQRIKGMGGKDQMPLGFAPMSPQKIALFERWIAEGASFEGTGRIHWSYVAPVKPAPPEVKGKAWIKSPIDAFVLAELEKDGLAPAKQAAKETLFRRMSLDITGLPPSPEEVDAFVKDRSNDAAAKALDRLLASPHYGERMAIPWLDLARYADSNGYEKDGNRTIWPYRDWVISAYNADMPYPQFIERQLAGDLLANPTPADLIATGFQRNTMLNEEGGVDKAEQRWLTLVDRVGTTGTVFLASSVGCAQCHDHKYDPTTQKDFYRLLAYYESSSEPSLLLDQKAVDALSEEASKLNKELTQYSGRPQEKEYKEKIAQVEAKLAYQRNVNSTLILREDPEKKAETPIRIKGAYLNPGEVVTPDTPSFLPKLVRGQAANRLSLAHWIGDRKNPLTARVAVNRVWEMLFGVGLVKTSEDFGTQGEDPRHRALLDWLAVEFMESGWSYKKLLKTIMLSATYQQTSITTPEKQEKDPENRLMSRGARFRLPAELIRDGALEASGLLSHKVGGPSVMPDQPEGIWNLPYSGERWTRSDGEDRWRRGVYTHWKRSAPYPVFLSFDATSREACTTRRIRTNTPLQALAMLNDEVMLEAAKSLAAKAWNKGLFDVRLAFRRVLARKPDKVESGRLSALFDQAKAKFDDKSATEVAQAPSGIAPKDFAASVVVCQTILNLDEAITKE